MSTPPLAQPPPQKLRKKRPSADVVSFEDLLAAHKVEREPGQLPPEGVVLIGVDLELQRRMAERIGLTKPDPGTQDQTAVNFGAPEFESKEIGEGENIGAPKFGAPEFSLDGFLLRRSGTKTYTVRPVSRIEDAFTSAERDLLRWLWEKGRPVPNHQRFRLVTGPNGEGARRLAAQAGLIYNTFKNLVRSLSTKFAVDIVKPERNLPTIYVVYHYTAILERQRQAGFTGTVHKNGGARELVNPQAFPAAPRPELSTHELEAMIGAQNFGAPKIGAGAQNFGALLGKFGAQNFGAPLRNKEYTSLKENPSTSSLANFGAPKIVGDALFERTGRTDGDAARMLAKGCLEANPTIQPEEIARLIRTAEIPANIANPVGLLIRTLPSRCAPESIAKYRERWHDEDEQEKRRNRGEHAQAAEMAKSILDSASQGEPCEPEILEWAKAVLTEESRKSG